MVISGLDWQSSALLPTSYCTQDEIRIFAIKVSDVCIVHGHPRWCAPDPFLLDLASYILKIKAEHIMHRCGPYSFLIACRSLCLLIEIFG